MAKTRKSVPLDDADLAGLMLLRTDMTWREAAMEIDGTHLSATPSEAEALQAMVAIGRRAIQARAEEKELEAGYTALAESSDREGREMTRALSRRTASRGPEQ
jgi:hypothetical protein